MYTICEGPKLDVPIGLKVSCPLIVNMTLFVNISTLFKWKYVYILTFSVAHSDTWDESF